MKLTLRTRLTVVYTGVFGLLLTALSVVSYQVLARQLDTDATASLTDLTNGLHGYLKFDSGTPTLSYDPVDADEAAFVHEATRYYQIFDADSGQPIVQSEAMEPLGLHFTPGEIRALPSREPFEDIKTDYGRIRLSNSIITSSGHSYLLQVGSSLEPLDRALDRFLALLLWSVPVGILAAIAAARWMTKLSLAPLLHLAEETRAIGIRDLQRRVTIRGTGDELDEVAVALNDTLARLEQATGEMRQFSTALAHELRTPLAALRGEIELAAIRREQDAAASERLASQLEEIDKLTRLIDQLPVSAATITITGARGTRTVTSDGRGRFTVPFLTPGSYSIQVELQGFKTAKRDDIVVSLGKTTEVPLTLDVGALSETVQVKSAPQLVNPAETTTGANLTSEMIQSVPVGRTVGDVLYMAPGVSSSNTAGRMNPSIAGGSALDNQYVIDGVNVTNTGYGALGSYSIVFGSLPAAMRPSIATTTGSPIRASRRSTTSPPTIQATGRSACRSSGSAATSVTSARRGSFRSIGRTRSSCLATTRRPKAWISASD